MDQSFLYQKQNSRLARLGTTAIKNLQGQQKGRSQKYIDNNAPGFRSKTQIPADSLQSFQSELDSIILNKYRNQKRKKPKKISEQLTVKNAEVDSLKSELDQIRVLLDQQKMMRKQNPAEEKIDKLIAELEGHKSLEIPQNNVQPFTTPVSPYLYPQQQPPYYPQSMSPQSYPFFYPFMMPYPNQYPPPSSRRHGNRRKYESDSQESSESNDSRRRRRKQKTPPLKSTTKNRLYEPRRDKLLKKFRAAAYAVAFTTFIKSQTRKLSTNRKANMKKFLQEKFGSQMNHLKNWLLDAFKYSLSIILEKGSLDFRLNAGGNQKFIGTQRSHVTNKSFMSSRVKSQKQKLLMQIIHIGISKLLEDSTPQKISMFVELIVYLCRKNSFALGRIWTAYEMQQLSISQQFGFIRMDQSLERYLVTILIFIKVLVFNMFLQPYKFDVQNFPKDREPLKTNMMYLGSIIYHITKEIAEEYRQKQRNSKIFKAGNWLKVKNQYIAECCEPMIYGRSAPEESEYISGLVPLSQISQLKSNPYWDGCKQKMVFIIDKVYKEMFNKAKLMRKNLKYKLYN